MIYLSKWLKQLIKHMIVMSQQFDSFLFLHLFIHDCMLGCAEYCFEFFSIVSTITEAIYYIKFVTV